MAHRKSLNVPLMQSFLYTDRRPSGDDFQQARHVREDLVEYLARLDAEKKSMEEALTVYERVLVPVRRLPPEILMEIFAWTRNSQSYHAHRVKGSPWVVSHVCRTWRAASLFCPELWNNFIVSHRSVHKKDPCSMLRAIVKRCQNVLHFVFRSIAKRTTSEKDEKLKALFQILLIHSEHWTVADLSLISDLIPMLSQIRGRLPNLCRLYFSSSYPDVDVIDGFEISPRLTDLTIDWQFNQKTQIAFSAAKLINFTDRRVPDPRHPHPSSLNIVRTAPDLQTFHNTDALPSRITPRIRHEHLTTINTCDPCLLSSLSLPALTDVTLSHPPAGFPPQSDGLQALHDLVSHSHCSLLSLRLLETPLNRHLSGILERSPKLTSLSLEFFQWRRTDDVCLKSIIAHESLMPHLKTLIFLHRFIRVVPDLDETAAKFVDAVFVDAVALRWKSSFLKTVQVDVDFPVSLSSADVARLKGLKEEGLGISLCAKSYDGSKIIV
ncbi:hypothetical protein EDD18DRAFT_1179873 [Armillaria luteobubalina]|uniref:F-box domain-containing protein n=1 Tax=Armillaria luteobubalina TaxID=153913 RepID=A0AA39PZD7_9AGAR|nr:hypothetical protein EDD18DRAFT_1179873 [Armillaria luteobubalina]